MLKKISQPAGTLSATSFDNSKVVGSNNRNDRKLAKFDFTKLMYEAEEFSFLTPDTRRAFIQLR